MSVWPNFQFVQSISSTFFPPWWASECEVTGDVVAEFIFRKEHWIRCKHESDLTRESKQCANAL